LSSVCAVVAGNACLKEMLKPFGPQQKCARERSKYELSYALESKNIPAIDFSNNHHSSLERKSHHSLLLPGDRARENGVPRIGPRDNQAWFSFSSTLLGSSQEPHDR
jgi:hypothetical protein